MSQQEAATAKKVAPTLDSKEAVGLNSQSLKESEAQKDPHSERTPPPHMILQLTMS